jgi:hypothetical protein
MSAAPDLIQPIIGYRQWRVIAGADGAPTLHSGGIGGSPWEPGVNHAACKLTQLSESGAYSPKPSVTQSAERPHQAPGHDCACGLYGMHALREPEDPTLPTGAIQAWGRIEVHPGGFRAEYARVVVLGLPVQPASEEAIAEVEAAAARYGVRCVEADLVEQAALELSRPVPADLRPRYEDRYEHERSPGAAPLEVGQSLSAMHRSASTLSAINRPAPATAVRRPWAHSPLPPGERISPGDESFEGAVLLGGFVIVLVIGVAMGIAALFG